MVNPYVLIATHQRLSITKKNIECLLKCNVGVILVVSDVDEYCLFQQLFPDISLVHHDNLPLGAKWQYGVEVARSLKADPLIINGSDDILSPVFFERVDELIKEGFHFIGLKCWYVYDMKSIYQFDYLAPLPLGGGRAYTKELLEKVDYQLFDNARDRHLDDLGWHNAYNSELKHIILHEPLILSVKGEWEVMNPLIKMFRSVNAKLTDSIYNPKPILKKFNYEG